MRARPNRVVLVALAAAGVLVVGSIAIRHGPLAGGAPARHAGTSGAAATRPAGASGPLPSLDIDAQLRRLPPLARGELAGTLVLSLNNCGRVEIPLATLAETFFHEGVCAVPGARFGVLKADLDATNVAGPTDSISYSVVDLAGREVGRIVPPDGWFPESVSRNGLVFCSNSPDGRVSGRLWLFAGGTVRLPGCPISSDGRYFPGRGRSSIVDRRGRVVQLLRTPVPANERIRLTGDGLMLVGTEVYRHGRLLTRIDEANGRVMGASHDGRVALVSNPALDRLRLYRDGVAHRIDRALAVHGGVVSADGTRLLLQSGDRSIVEIDAATLRPLARLDLQTDMVVNDWLAPGG
jgi:hypothetical protein